MNNTFGTLFSLTTAGESHGPALVGIVDGMPAGIRIDFEAVNREMRRRRPGQPLATARNEADQVEFLSGILSGVTLGTPIAFMIRNSDARSADYEHLKKTFRPSHADFTYQAKYGIRDVRGGGRSSARETALRVVAGALAMQALEARGIVVEAFTSAVGSVELPHPFEGYDLSKIWESPVRCPDSETSKAMESELEEMRRCGDTAGCVVAGIVTGLPVGLGEPVYNKLQARLAFAMMGINAAHGFDYGSGFGMAGSRGSQVKDDFEMSADGSLGTSTNHSGGIQGGISNGMPVTFRVAFKPLPTLMRELESVDMRGEKTVISPRGRHDVCAVPRAVPVVRAMAAVTVLDMLLMAEATKNF